MTAAMININRTADGAVLVEVRGDIDIATSTKLRDLLVEVARQLPTKIVVDLLHVTFIDSTGIGALAKGRNAAHQMGIGFTVRHPSAFVGRQLRQTGLYDKLVTDR